MVSTFNESEFRSNIIELIHFVYPNLAGEKMMDIQIENISRLGTDYQYSNDGTMKYYAGDRIVRVSMELFSPNAMEMVSHIKDMWGTVVLRSKMQNMKICHILGDDVYDSSRIHGETQFVNSVEWVTKFQAITEYSVDIDELSYINNVELDGEIYK